MDEGKDVFEDEIDINEFVVFIDTNILLLPIQFKQIDIKLFIKILLPFLPNIIITPTVWEEFEHGWEKVRDRAKQDIREKEGEINSHFSKISKIANQLEISDSLIQEFVSIQKSCTDEIKMKINEEISNYDMKCAEMKSRIQGFLHGKIKWIELPFSEKLAIYREGEFRYKYQIPPGFCDSKKGGLEQYQDLVIWKELIHEGIERKKLDPNYVTFIFLTNDNTKDWRSPEAEESLKNEFMDFVRSDLKILSLTEFQEFFKDEIKLSETEILNIVQTMKSINNETEIGPLKISLEELIEKGVTFENIESYLSAKEIEEFYTFLARNPNFYEELPLRFLGLTIRSQNCLNNANMRTVSDFIGKTYQEIAKTRNFGKYSLAEIDGKCKALFERINTYKK